MGSPLHFHDFKAIFVLDEFVKFEIIIHQFARNYFECLPVKKTNVVCVPKKCPMFLLPEHFPSQSFPVRS